MYSLISLTLTVDREAVNVSLPASLPSPPFLLLSDRLLVGGSDGLPGLVVSDSLRGCVHGVMVDGE